MAQYITFRIEDSLPSSIVIRWKQELDLEQSAQARAIMRRRVEAYLDQGHGNCFLRNPVVAEIVQNALLFHDQSKYRLTSWVIMPNHVHMICTPCCGFSLAEGMHSIKSFTATEINRMLARSGRFWQKEYFDRYIRNTKQFARTVAYIENNPVNANLCDRPEEWPFSSARLRMK